MKKSSRIYNDGAVHPTTIALIVMIVLFIAAGVFGILSFINYSRERTTNQAQIDVAVAEATKKQADEDEKKFAEREKEPNRQFVGPDDFGRVTFMYPKHWSVYEAQALASGGSSYQALLHPYVVPMNSNTQKFALRVSVETADIDTVLAKYERQIERGELRSSPFSANGNQGTRLDGLFAKDQEGAMVVMKIRDKTLTLKTDAPQFVGDFNTIVASVDFNK